MSLIAHMRAKIEFRRAERVARIVGPHVQGRTLDVGTWSGDVARRLPVQDIVGIDVKRPAQCAIPLSLYDGLSIPFSDQEFDTVVCCFVLHHAERPDQLLREMRRVGKRIVVLEDSVETACRRWSVFSLHEAMRRGIGMPYQADGFHTCRQWSQEFTALGLGVIHHSSHAGVLDWPCLRHELFVLRSAVEPKQAA